MKYLIKSFLFSLILLTNLFFCTLLSADNHNIYEILEKLNSDVKTLEKAVYSQSNELENNNIAD